MGEQTTKEMNETSLAQRFTSNVLVHYFDLFITKRSDENNLLAAFHICIGAMKMFNLYIILVLKKQGTKTQPCEWE